ncbi:MAG: DUF4342 domain-containing protein [Lachnospiraceae bacterium]|nr:DUF4342 domain-containing protein [Lachnospiraceae bacterium]
MDELEKVEKLRQRADVSYEEAREALNECNGDLLDAMVYLEKQGKVKSPEQTAYTTDAEQQPKYADVPAVVRENEQRSSEESVGKKIGRMFKKAAKYLNDNHLKVEHNDKTIINVPLWVAVIALLAAWWILVILIIISLFCDYKYTIEGTGNNEEVNRVMEKASEFTEQVKDEFKNN